MIGMLADELSRASANEMAQAEGMLHAITGENLPQYSAIPEVQHSYERGFTNAKKLLSQAQ